MDQTAALNAISKLVQQYPGISESVADVLEACQHDPICAYDKLSEMLMPQQQQSPTPHIIHSQNDSTVLNSNSNTPTKTAGAGAGAGAITPLKGAWATANMGRTYRVDEMCKKYSWLDRKVAYSLFEKHQDCAQLVEADVLQMFPLDEPGSYAVSNTNTTNAKPNAVSTENRYLSASISETLRDEAEAEMRNVRNPQPSLSINSPCIINLRNQTWEQRQVVTDANHLAALTRKQSIIDDARKKTDELQKLSVYLLERIRQTDEYKAGSLDLHGLTKDEAITLVDWKLADSVSTSSSPLPKVNISSNNNHVNTSNCNNNSRRFIIITGRGNNSLHHQAVLRPALERHLKSKGISFSYCRDGIISVMPSTF